ncbi:hypothetical protein JIN85_20725, partial [Luteolibacter pohnpeiensis]
MKKRFLGVLACIVLVAGIAAMVWESQSKFDLATEESPFNSIVLPLKNIRGGVYMDGGSVCVGIDDSAGSSYDFIFPFDHKTKGYPAAFHGAMEPYAPGAVP